MSVRDRLALEIMKSRIDVILENLFSFDPSDVKKLREKLEGEGIDLSVEEANKVVNVIMFEMRKRCY